MTPAVEAQFVYGELRSTAGSVNITDERSLRVAKKMLEALGYQFREQAAQTTKREGKVE